jgi:hypothetical protein
MKAVEVEVFKDGDYYVAELPGCKVIYTTAQRKFLDVILFRPPAKQPSVRRLASLVTLQSTTMDGLKLECRSLLPVYWDACGHTFLRTHPARKNGAFGSASSCWDFRLALRQLDAPPADYSQALANAVQPLSFGAVLHALFQSGFIEWEWKNVSATLFGAAVFIPNIDRNAFEIDRENQIDDLNLEDRLSFRKHLDDCVVVQITPELSVSSVAAISRRSKVGLERFLALATSCPDHEATSLFEDYWQRPENLKRRRPDLREGLIDQVICKAGRGSPWGDSSRLEQEVIDFRENLQKLLEQKSD